MRRCLLGPKLQVLLLLDQVKDVEVHPKWSLLLVADQISLVFFIEINFTLILPPPLQYLSSTHTTLFFKAGTHSLESSPLDQNRTTE